MQILCLRQGLLRWLPPLSLVSLLRVVVALSRGAKRGLGVRDLNPIHGM